MDHLDNQTDLRNTSCMETEGVYQIPTQLFDKQLLERHITPDMVQTCNWKEMHLYLGVKEVITYPKKQKEPCRHLKIIHVHVHVYIYISLHRFIYKECR